ncbi:hypothetical protein ACQP1G_34745 [Nocardia sp. CA-107356]
MATEHIELTTDIAALQRLPGRERARQCDGGSCTCSRTGISVS